MEEPQAPLYVLDTNVLLYDPASVNAFPGADVVVPLHVIEEIDKFKSVMSATGNSARTVSQILDQYRQQGNLTEGINLPNEGRLLIPMGNPTMVEFPEELDLERSCNRTLLVAYNLMKQRTDVTLVTQDTNVRVKANVLQIPTISYDGARLQDEPYAGLHRVTVSNADLRHFRDRHILNREIEWLPNEGVLITNEEDEHDTEMAIYDHGIGHLRPFMHDEGVWGIIPRNPEQHLALELLLDPEIPIVTLNGKAGTGKTLLALAVGLHLMLMENRYTRMLVSRPIFPMGRDIGYLPGDLNEKLDPWMQPIFDNLELLISSSGRKGTTKGYQELMDQGFITVEPLTYIRGRSIPHQYMIVDEAQNLTPHEMKTIVTRAGEDTKIVLTGDPHQIDNPYVNQGSNGLNTLVERLKPYSLAGHVTLLYGERSPLADLAANVL
jgi:PhoH-like ATPase